MPHQHNMTIDDFPPETQEWIRQQSAKADPIDDEWATHIVGLFLPEDHPAFVVVSVPLP